LWKIWAELGWFRSRAQIGEDKCDDDSDGDDSLQRFPSSACTPKWIVGGASSLRVGQKLVGGRRCCVQDVVSVGPLWIYWNGFSGLDVLSHFGGPAGLVLYILFLSRCGSCGVSYTFQLDLNCCGSFWVVLRTCWLGSFLSVIIILIRSE